MDTTLYIRDVAKAHNITLSVVASRMGYNTPQQLYNLLKGNITIASLQRIAAAIGCDVSEFFTGPTSNGAQPRRCNDVTCPHCGKPLRIYVDCGD